MTPNSIPTLPLKAAGGHHFVIYGDSCSGVPGALHESTFRQVNGVLQALDRRPQFICFLGDEIMGLSSDADALRAQWAHFFTQEMAWLDRRAIPLYHTTGNHSTYSRLSEAVFREVMAHLPPNGPPQQRGLSYFVRRGDLLMIFVHSGSWDLGGEGRVETEWLAQTLQQQADARHKLVFGHHPVWAVNGFFGDFQRHIERENGRRFWRVLVQHGVLAYVCSHILAFDVQVRQGVLQICSAGAGTAHRMPPETEYLHLLQAVLDEGGLRYQVIDADGRVREWLCWDWRIPPAAGWADFDADSGRALPADALQDPRLARLLVWEITGQLSEGAAPQTLLATQPEAGALPALWLGAGGRERRLMLMLSPRRNRSPHSWHGPPLPVDRAFRIQFAIHSGMGPGGLLWRWDDDAPWSSLQGASDWGPERLRLPPRWTIGAAPQVRRLRWHQQGAALDELLRG